MTELQILVGVSVVMLLSAVVHDVAFRTIPNWMSMTLLAFGGEARLIDGRLVPGLLACGLIFSGAAFCWRSGWLGGGDVKLLSACGLLVPPGMSVAMLLDTAVAGGLLALLYLLLGQVVARPSKDRPSGLLPRLIRVERFRVARRGPLPYASAIAAGTLFVLLKG